MPWAAAVPIDRRGLALNIKTTGVPLLVAVGAVLGPPLADRVGWRWTFVGIAVVAAMTGRRRFSGVPGHLRAGVGDRWSGRPGRHLALSRGLLSCC